MSCQQNVYTAGKKSPDGSGLNGGGVRFWLSDYFKSLPSSVGDSLDLCSGSTPGLWSITIAMARSRVAGLSDLKSLSGFHPEPVTNHWPLLTSCSRRNSSSPFLNTVLVISRQIVAGVISSLMAGVGAGDAPCSAEVWGAGCAVRLWRRSVQGGPSSAPASSGISSINWNAIFGLKTGQRRFFLIPVSNVS